MVALDVEDVAYHLWLPVSERQELLSLHSDSILLPVLSADEVSPIRLHLWESSPTILDAGSAQDDPSPDSSRSCSREYLQQDLLHVKVNALVDFSSFVVCSMLTSRQQFARSALVPVV